jgi:hypothetical protein
MQVACFLLQECHLKEMLGYLYIQGVLIYRRTGVRREDEFTA